VLALVVSSESFIFVVDVDAAAVAADDVVAVSEEEMCLNIL
jgi:hypothetical protein